MLNMLVHLHWRAVLAAGLLHYLLGAAWGSSPIGAAYYRALGFEPPAGWQPGPAMYWVPLAGCLAAAVATALLARAAGARTARAGMALGLVVGLGYAAAVAAMDAVAPHQARPAVLFAILGGYHLVSLVLGGAIVAAWQPAPAAGPGGR